MKEVIIWILGLATLFIMLILFEITLSVGNSNGQYGDFFGGFANPVITFAALIALLYSIKIQKEELKATSEALQKQNFENAFFRILDAINYSRKILQENKLNDLGLRTLNDIIVKQNDYITSINKIVSSEFAIKNAQLQSIEGLISLIDTQPDTGERHIGLIVSLLNYIDSSDLNYEKKKFFANLFFQSLPINELFFLFIFGLKTTVPNTVRAELKSLIEKFAGFESLQTHNLYPTISANLSQYNISAYGNNKGALILYQSDDKA